ncbi:N-acetyltransferase [Marinilongibacter aquaticus]|uniref:acyltransferase n=1 Tax=Marinilongibacter aquaticus TaxID=2975157 RepID=UPI0021BD2F57|nr:acyltransferase [Marinilongibacter aquaticus]UBM57637.1 N-acetyltransferase [Marinilongibacter aquaticus]
MSNLNIHRLSDVQTSRIGQGTTIWQYCIILPNAIIGKECNICSHVFIENDVEIGNRVTIKSGVQLWDGLRIEDDVFVGPNVTFTNDLIPRSKQFPSSFLKTFIKRGASIGANSTIIAGNSIGEYSLIGAGSVVTCDIPPFHLFYGNPARHMGYLTKEGISVGLDFKSADGAKYNFFKGELIKK